MTGSWRMSGWRGGWGRPPTGKLWQPMLEGKFGTHFHDVNLAWFWARVYKRTPRLGYYRGGFQGVRGQAGIGGVGEVRDHRDRYAGAGRCTAAGGRVTG